MKEKVLYFLWKYHQFSNFSLKTTDNKIIEINKSGIQNTNAGPDFLNASLIIDNQKWVGNVEIHQKSSDWYLHNHHLDDNYNAVILHVVWEHDMEVYNKSQLPIPTLELKHTANEDFLKSYTDFLSYPKKWILCENQLKKIDSFQVDNWLEKLYFERLERKYNEITELLLTYKNDWEAVLFLMISKSFGTKINGDVFLQIAKSIDFKLVRKEKNNLLVLESLFFGKAGLLNEDHLHAYFLKLKKSYSYLRSKYQIIDKEKIRCNFFRLRPSNFPTIRLAQLAQLYHQRNSLFLELMEAKSMNSFYKIFNVQASEFWDTHYTFNKETSRKTKSLTKSFVDMLIINTVIPLKFAYYQQQQVYIEDELIAIMQAIKPEKNSVIEMYDSINLTAKDSLQSQALLQLKNEYCDKINCLECSFGKIILGK